MWDPLSLHDMRHILAQTGDFALPDEVVGQLARGFTVPHDTLFHFSARHRTLGATSIFLTNHSAFRFCGADVADTPGMLNIGFVLSGGARLGLARGPLTGMPPGSAYAVTNWHEFDLEATDATRGLTIRVPEKRLHTRGIRTRHDRFRLASQTTVGAPLRSFASAMVATAWHPGAIGETIAERTLEDLIVGMFLETEGYAMDGEEFRSGLRGRAVNLVATAHREPGLNPSVVAGRLGVSLRNLQRAFEEGGTTLAEEIGRQRARTAAVLLAGPGTRSLPISEIAALSGFRSPFALRAGFRSRYGVLPSEYRAAPAPVEMA